MQQSVNPAAEPGATSREVDPDSLRQAIEKLKSEAEKLRSQVDAINDSIEQVEDFREDEPAPEKSALVQQDTSTSPKKDTVQVLSREGTQAFLESIRGKKRGGRERGYGGAIGPTPGIFAINVRPVHELLDVLSGNDEFRDISFPLEGTWQSFFLMGLTGYGAVGNGMRIGGSYRGGSRSYSTRHDDSTYSVEVRVAFGGFLLEKAFVAGSMNWFIGGIAGASNIVVQPSKASNLLVSTPLHLDEEIDKTFNKLNAPSLLLELHGGFTYTMVNWFHIGLDLSTPLFFSPSGFKSPGDQSITNGFITINPGLRIRIILGNIG